MSTSGKGRGEPPTATVLATCADGIGRITLNRPECLNSFSARMHEELREALARLRHAKVIVLTGAGRGFCAGDDMSERCAFKEISADLGNTVEACWNPLIRQITGMPQPVIARVNGVAAGAGANIALACDIVIAARSAEFIQSCSANGLAPHSGGSWALPRLVGQARALGLALLAQPLPAEKAAEWGLIWKAVDDGQLDAEVDSVANRLASLPPLGLGSAKQMIRSSWQHSLEEELRREASSIRRLGFTPDYRAKLVSFLERGAHSPEHAGRLNLINTISS
jgi:2-(1,2-epoxy-1,2-dihydrophenyl)acetyl-CoA isomerase